MEPIILYPHDPEWLVSFEKEKAKLIETLPITISDVHHVGSTAVPGLLAKPVIDIAIESTCYPPAIDIQEALAGIGYEYKGESGIKGRIWFIKGHPRAFNLHYCLVGSDIVRKQVQFTKRLKESASLRAEYQALKSKNYKGKDIDDAEYALSKSMLIEKALSKS